MSMTPRARLLEQADRADSLRGEELISTVTFLFPQVVMELKDAEAEVARLRTLISEALSKGPERRCPWCWVVAIHGKHAVDCRARNALGSEGGVE